VILAIGAPLIGWFLIHGLRTGVMSAAGVPYATYARSDHPIMFWPATIFNAVVCAGSAVLVVTGL